MQCLVWYKEFQPDGRKCPVLQITDLCFARRDNWDLAVSLSMGIFDKIEDPMIAIDETKISEIEVTKRPVRPHLYGLGTRDNPELPWPR